MNKFINRLDLVWRHQSYREKKILNFWSQKILIKVKVHFCSVNREIESIKVYSDGESKKNDQADKSNKSEADENEDQSEEEENEEDEDEFGEPEEEETPENYF